MDMPIDQLMQQGYSQGTVPEGTPPGTASPQGMIQMDVTPEEAQMIEDYRKMKEQPNVDQMLQQGYGSQNASQEG